MTPNALGRMVALSSGFTDPSTPHLSSNFNPELISRRFSANTCIVKMSTSRIIQLAKIISSQTSLIDQHLQSNHLPEPSFHQDGPTEPIQKETPDIQRAKTDVIEATIELRQLLEGPMKLVLPEVCLSHDSTAIIFFSLCKQC